MNLATITWPPTLTNHPTTYNRGLNKHNTRHVYDIHRPNIASTYSVDERMEKRRPASPLIHNKPPTIATWTFRWRWPKNVNDMYSTLIAGTLWILGAIQPDNIKPVFSNEWRYLAMLAVSTATGSNYNYTCIQEHTVTGEDDIENELGLRIFRTAKHN